MTNVHKHGAKRLLTLNL